MMDIAVFLFLLLMLCQNILTPGCCVMPWQVNQEGSLPEAFVRGLSSAHLSGRAQIIYDHPKDDFSSERGKSSSGDLIFYLDGAHSPESMEFCAKWFSSAVKGKTKPPSLSSFLTPNVEKIKQVLGNGTNGYIRHEISNLGEGEEVNKISKKVNFVMVSQVLMFMNP